MASLPPLTWMLVEDEPDMYEMLLQLSETLGFNGLAFPTYDLAMAWIDDFDAGRLADPAPALALIDVRLVGPQSKGDSGGQYIGARLRQSERLRHIPVIMMSAYINNNRERDEIMRVSRANLFIKKPLPPIGEFRRIIENLLYEKA